MHAQIAGKLTGRITKWFVLVGVLVAVAIFGSMSGKLIDEQNNENETWLPESAESTQAIEKLNEFQDEYDVGTTVVYYKESGLTPEDLAAIESQASELEDVEGVSDVITPQRAEANGAQFPFVSEDGQVAKLEFTVNYGDKLWEEIPDAAEDIRDVTEIDGVEVYLAGAGGSTADSATAFSGFDGKLLGAALLAVIVILLISYRSAFLWILPIVSALVSLGISMGLLYLLAKYADLTINGQTQFIMTVLVIGAGTDYALLLIARYREELRRHEDRHEAMAFALHRAAPAILASAATVAVGLLCLMFADLNSTAGLGPANAVAIVVTYLVMVTLLPALLVIFGRWVFGPRAEHHRTWVVMGASMIGGGILVSVLGGVIGGTLGGFIGALGGLTAFLGLLALIQVGIEHWTNVHSRPEFGSEEPTQKGMWAKVGNRISGRPRIVWVVTAAVLVLLSLGFLRLDTSGVPSDEQFTSDVDSVVGQEILIEHRLVDASTPIQVVTNADQAAAVSEAITGIEGIDTPREPVVIGDTALINADLTSDPYSEDAKEAVRDVRDAAHDVPDADALVAGWTAVTLDIQEASARDNKVVIPIVLVAVLLILIGLLRALLSPILLIGTVILSFAAALGLSGLIFDFIYGFENTDPGFPLFAFVFLVALGIDYNIFLMTRVREESINHGTRKGSLIALSSTGGVITAAGFVLAATFSALATMPFTFTLQLGTTIALGVLLDTMIVRSVLVTALNLDLGDKIWWPSKLARRGDDADPDAASEPEKVLV